MAAELSFDLIPATIATAELKPTTPASLAQRLSDFIYRCRWIWRKSELASLTIELDLRINEGFKNRISPGSLALGFALRRRQPWKNGVDCPP